MPRATVIARRRKGQHTMATPLSRLPEPGDGSAQAAVTISAVTEYLLPATMRGIAAQAMAALGVLTGLWIALSPSFLTLQHGGGNAAVANLIAGLAVTAVAAASLAGPRGYAGRRPAAGRRSGAYDEPLLSRATSAPRHRSRPVPVGFPSRRDAGDVRQAVQRPGPASIGAGALRARPRPGSRHPDRGGIRHRRPRSQHPVQRGAHPAISVRGVRVRP